MPRRKKFFRVLLKILSGLVSFALLVFACLSLIIAQPQPDKIKEPEPQALLSPAPAIETRSESELTSVASSFPAPLMSFVASSGMRFVSASARDAAVDGGTGRVATLNWQTPDGEPVILQSIYPASALSLLGNDYHFVWKLGPTLFGSDSVYMEANGAVRLHARTDSALYVVIVPPAVAPKLTALSQSLQLLSMQ